MRRHALTISYDGTEFHGWQRQRIAAPAPGEEPELRTVQSVVERAVRESVREPIELRGASRTDSGVHALAQCAAFSTTDDRRGPPDERLALAINSRLPEDCLVTSCRAVHPMFDPVRHCVSKGYRYSIADTPDRPLWDRRFVHHIHTPLDDRAMAEAAVHFVGRRDFAACAAAGHGRLSTVRTVLSCEVVRTGAGRIAIDVSGDGFLYNMVRIIAGTLLDVGRGRRAPAEVPSMLGSLDRARMGPTLPACGLRLEWIRYPDEAMDPSGPGIPRVREREEWAEQQADPEAVE